VEVAGYNQMSDTSGWYDIIAISASCTSTVGLKSDGTVLATGGFISSFSDWKNIVEISSGNQKVIGLKSDGTVVVANATYVSIDTSQWRDIVNISAGSSHVVGLKADGKVLATGDNEYGQCNVSNWRNIVAIYTYFNGDYTIGLKDDGSIVVTGTMEYGDSNGKRREIGDITSWRRIGLGSK